MKRGRQLTQPQQKNQITESQVQATRDEIGDFDDDNSQFRYAGNGLWWFNGSGKRRKQLPPYYSHALDTQIYEEIASNDNAQLLQSAYSEKFAGREWRIEPLPDSDWTVAEAREVQAIFQEYSKTQGRYGIQPVIELYAQSLSAFCNGAFAFILGQSEQIEPPRNAGIPKSELIAGPLAPLTIDGNIVTYTNGVPVMAVGVKYLDSTRVNRTGNAEWPYTYQDINGQLRLLHYTRVITDVVQESSMLMHYGTGYSPYYKSRKTLLTLDGYQNLTLALLGEEMRQAILYAKQGATLDDLTKGLRKADEKIANKQARLRDMPAFAPKEIDPEVTLELDILDLQVFPEGYDEVQSVVINMARAAANYGLTLGDIGMGSVARMASRANSEIEAAQKRTMGIPQQQANWAQSISSLALPQGLCWTWEPINQIEAKERAEIDKTESETAERYWNMGIITPLTVLEDLHADGEVTDEQFERERARLTGERVEEVTEDDTGEEKSVGPFVGNEVVIPDGIDTIEQRIEWMYNGGYEKALKEQHERRRQVDEYLRKQRESFEFTGEVNSDKPFHSLAEIIGIEPNVYEVDSDGYSKHISVVQKGINDDIATYEEKLDAISLLVANGDITESEAQTRIDELAQAMIMIGMLLGSAGNNPNVLNDTGSELLRSARAVLDNDGMTRVTPTGAQDASLARNLAAISDEQAIVDAFNRLDIDGAQALADINEFNAIHEESSGNLLQLVADTAQDAFAVGLTINTPQYAQAISAGIRDRVRMWGRKVGQFRAAGLMYDPRDPLLRWRRGATEEGCVDCIGFDGTERRASEWRAERAATGRYPRSGALECGGWNCLCYFERVASN